MHCMASFRKPYQRHWRRLKASQMALSALKLLPHLGHTNPYPFLQKAHNPGQGVCIWLTHTKSKDKQTRISHPPSSHPTQIWHVSHPELQKNYQFSLVPTAAFPAFRILLLFVLQTTKAGGVSLGTRLIKIGRPMKPYKC